MEINTTCMNAFMNALVSALIKQACLVSACCCSIAFCVVLQLFWYQHRCQHSIVPYQSPCDPQQGQWTDARHAFRTMLSPASRMRPSVITFNTIMSHYNKQAQHEKVREVSAPADACIVACIAPRKEGFYKHPQRKTSRVQPAAQSWAEP